jgi:hypothetical protein
LLSLSASSDRRDASRVWIAAFSEINCTVCCCQAGLMVSQTVIIVSVDTLMFNYVMEAELSLLIWLQSKRDLTASGLYT